MTLEQAKSLVIRQVIYHAHTKNADGTPQRWRVSGKVQTWKTRPHQVRVPLTHGLYVHDYLDENCLDLMVLTEKEAGYERK